jgi:hypothetical protein
MAFDESSFLGSNFSSELPTTEISPPDRRKTFRARKSDDGDSIPKRKYRKRGGEEPRSDLPVEGEKRSLIVVSPEDREKAQRIIDDIGQRFSENRLKSQSMAFEQYQRDLADNASFIVKGGFMTMKELSEMLMKLEEFRKRDSSQGKTPVTLLAEWLRGETIEGVDV